MKALGHSHSIFRILILEHLICYGKKIGSLAIPVVTNPPKGCRPLRRGENEVFRLFCQRTQKLTHPTHPWHAITTKSLSRCFDFVVAFVFEEQEAVFIG